MLDRIEIWAIGRQILKRMPGVDHRGLYIPPLVERGIIHDEDRCRWQLGQQVLLGPGGTGSGIHVGVEQAYRQHVLPDQRTDHVGPPACVPVMHAVTPLAGRWHSRAAAAYRVRSRSRQCTQSSGAVNHRPQS